MAVLIDGGFFLKRVRHQYPDVDQTDAKAVAALIHAHALRHKKQQTNTGPYGERLFEDFDLYRIFFYDCAPLEKKAHRPVSRQSVDFGRLPSAQFRRELHEELKKKRKVALRMGHLIDTTEWKLKPGVLKALTRRDRNFQDLTDDDFVIDTLQKGVDMRLGLDVASLAYKRLVDQIILIVGDSDFVPAAKLARREGLDVVLDRMGSYVHPDLNEHIDGVRTFSSRSRPSTSAGTIRGVVESETVVRSTAVIVEPDDTQ